MKGFCVMGIFEKNIIIMVLRFVFRWMASNEKNNENKNESKKK